MKIKVLFLITLILFGTLLFSNIIDRDLPINEWDMMKQINDTKANGDSLNCTLVGRTLFGQCFDVFVKDTIAYSCHWNSLLIFNIKNATNPILLGFYSTNDLAKGVYVVDSFAYVVDWSTGLRIINVSDPENPTETGFYDTGGSARGIYVIDTFAYVADHDDGLYIIKYPMGGTGIEEENKFIKNVSINNYYIKYNLSTIDIYFGLKERGELNLDIYDKMGRQLHTINNGIIESGYTRISINKNEIRILGTVLEKVE